MKNLSVAWLYMWAISYFIVSAIAPNIGGEPVWQQVVLFIVFGLSLLIAVTLKAYAYKLLKNGSILQKIGNVMLVVLAVISVYSGVWSWAGVGFWNVPFANKELFQVSMAFADLIAGALMIELALEPIKS